MLVITKHARERWVERIADPKRYEHLKFCNKNCSICTSLYYDLSNATRMARNSIDIQIRKYYEEAKTHNWIVDDKKFIAAQKQFGDYEKFIFYVAKNNAIFIVAIDEEIPVLCSVLTIEMIDGTVINTNSDQKLKSIFQSWKHEARMKNFDKRMKNI